MVKNETENHCINNIIHKKKKVQATLAEFLELGIINQTFKYDEHHSRSKDLRIDNLQTCNQKIHKL